MNNEPVAWRNLCVGNIGEDSEWIYNEIGQGEPLYTHPAKYCPSENNAAYEKGFIDGMAKMTESAVHRAVEGMSEKTLTDEEITAISKEIFKDYKNFHHYQIDFARAILRKAQEK
jgi:hypothetical protein